MRIVLKRLSLILLIVAFTATLTYAQNGVIEGTLVDSQGKSIPNAKVSAVDEAKALVVRETTSADDGSFQLRPLQRGTYTVKAESQGFKTLERSGLVLDINQSMNLGEVGLEVGSVAATVNVTADVPLVETTTAQKSFVISSTQITELSLNGRDFTALMRTLPGVTSAATTDFRLQFNDTGSFNVNGGRTSMNNVYLDGTINTDVGDNGSQYTQLSLDAVGEFKVQTSTFNAEFGRNTGVIISATTKSGGKDFHGTLYDFLRNDALDARRPFDTTGNPPKVRFNQFGGNIGGPLALPRFGEGGPALVKGKTFFFFNYEGTRGSQPTGPAFVDVPHPDLLQGDFRRLLRNTNIANSTCRYPGESTNRPCQNGTVFRPGSITRDANGNIIGGDPYPNNTVPRSEWSRSAPGFLNILNRVDRSGAGPAAANAPELVRVPLNESYVLDKDQFTLRLDHNFSPNASFFFRWVNDAQAEFNNYGIFGTTSYPVFPMYREKPGSSWSWNLVNVVSPNITNELIVAYTHQSQVVDVQPGVDPSTYDRDALGFQYAQIFPRSNLRNKFPEFNCGVGGCGFNSFAAGWLNDGKDYALTDNVTYVRGNHTFKTGVFLNLDDKQQQPSWADEGNFNFGSSRDNPNDSGITFANMLLGNYTSYLQADGRYYGKFRYNGVEFYGQDTWRVNRKLILEFGARYVYMSPTYTLGQLLQSYFDPSRYDRAQAVRIETARGLAQGSIIPGSGNPFNGMVRENEGIPAGFSEHRKNQISPRFGFAYDLFGDGKTAIRGGFGTFFERIRQNVNNFDGLGNPPLSYTPNLFAGNLDNLSPALVSGGTRFPVQVRAFDKEGKVPTIYAWSLGVQRELPSQISLDVAYVGNTARHLQYVQNLNQLPLGATLGTGNVLSQAGGVTNAVRPYLGYTNVLFTDYGAISNYHSLQARVSRRFASRLTANVNYTWAKSLDEVSADNTEIGYYQDRRREYGPSDFDRAHVLTLDYVYQLPRLGTRLNNGVGRFFLDGWEISGITRFWSGLPLTIASSGNPGTLGAGVRANYLGGPVYPERRTRDEFFNPLAFGRPLDGQLGNTGRGFLRGPGINNWDFSVFKNTNIGERIRTQLRAEIFNVFNHTQWTTINTNIGNASGPGTPVTAATRGTIGQVNNTRDPRNIQLALKIYF